MDLKTVYRDELPYESDFLQAQLFAAEALGLFTLDVMGGTATAVAGLACTATAPASLNVKVGPGRIYKYDSLLAADLGKRLGTGGLDADTAVDHKIMKQGVLRDPQQFAIAPPGVAGQSQCYLIQAQFQEVDDAVAPAQFYNTANPNAPISADVSPARRAKCVLGLKAGAAAATGSQSAPTADAGWIPVWVITVANGATTITAGNIAAAAGAPFLSIGSGGGGATPTNWTTVNANYTASAGDRLVADTSGGAFTVTLPAAPVADSTTVRIKGNFATNNLTVQGNGHNWAGFANPLILDKDYIDVTVLFDGTNWRI
jgi:hypothetical protein